MGNVIDSEQQASKSNKAQGKLNLLSDATLKIVRKGPDQVNITVIDIPGMVSCKYSQPGQNF
jgi:hypothetical protein